MVNKEFCQVLPKGGFASPVFLGILYCTGSIYIEYGDRMWQCIKSELTYARGVGFEIPGMGAQCRGNEEAYSMVDFLRVTR